MFFRFFIIFACLTLASCSKQVSRYSSDNLSCIQIIDRNDLSETIGTKDRLKKYQATDFTQPQPYQQVLRIFAKDALGKTPSILTSYHPNGQIHKYLEVLDARAYGLYREWHENGELKIEATVIGGAADLSPSTQKEWLFDDICFVWDDKGNPLAKIPYEKGVLQGVAIHKHPNGEIAKIIPYEKNQLQGEFAEFDLEGQPILKINFHQDLKHGDALRYWPNGYLSSLEVYKSGLLQQGKYFSKKGEKVSDVMDGQGKQAIFNKKGLDQLITYKNGYPRGLIESFSSSGSLLSSHYIKNGMKSGKEILYYSDEELFEEQNTLIPKMSIEWKDDQIHGMVKTWYPSGVLQSQKVIYHNKRNGSACCWYENGKIMFVEEYEDDALLKGKYFKINETEPISQVQEGAGIATIYDEKGIFVKKVPYEKGAPVDSSN